MKLLYKFSIVGSFLGLWITSLLPEKFELILGFLLIFTFGMVHGSNDVMIVNTFKKIPALKPYKILFFYLLIVSSAVLVFYLLPSIALVLFILFSAYHFGEQHWNEITLQWLPLWRIIFYFSYGLLILFLIFSSNDAEVKHIIFDITGHNIENIYSTPVLLLLTGLLVAVALSQMRRYQTDLSLIKNEIVSLLVLIIIFRSSSLIWGFCIYFILWHSIPSLVDQITFVYGNLKSKSILEYTLKALPYWIVSLIGIVGLYAIFKDDKSFYSLFFAFIAAVTFPHALVMLKMFSLKTEP